ncbi:MAG: membrane-bound lytic murein transglycosylase MltF [Gammaproteobacteria bacterium]|nr:membrane-bound lytic murein transglycosylase MltF [Gammaproteobacteria bacterium]
MPRNINYLIAILLILPLILSCSHQSSVLEQVLESGELTVLTRNAATTYYEGADGKPTGMEYDLFKGFSDKLGVKLKVITTANVTEILEQLADGEAHFAAAGLTITRARETWVHFTQPYQEITQQLVFRLGNAKPKDLEQLDGRLEILANSSHAENLRTLKQKYPNLSWVENDEDESEELLTSVAERVIDYTIADSNEVALNQRYYPELKVAFDVTKPEYLAWAFPKSQDTSLYQAAVEYFQDLKITGRMDQIIERHYGHLGEFDYVGTRIFIRHIKERLPNYRDLFQQAAADNQMDWRLLAAMAYQESHWNPSAVSPTGVRGMMMLTKTTAHELGVKERSDATESINGGARYIKKLLDRVPEEITSPDRIWMGVAAYNFGYGHLSDARHITRMRKGDPNYWLDVKESLPLLRKRAWYQKTKHGYARGNEAARYVENIRQYYDILVWITEQEKPPTPPGLQALNIVIPAL